MVPVVHVGGRSTGARCWTSKLGWTCVSQPLPGACRRPRNTEHNATLKFPCGTHATGHAMQNKLEQGCGMRVTTTADFAISLPGTSRPQRNTEHYSIRPSCENVCNKAAGGMPPTTNTSQQSCKHAPRSRMSLPGHAADRVVQSRMRQGCAPDLAYGAEAGAQWWSEAAATLRQLRLAGAPLFVFGDTNARVGSVQSAYVGGHQPDQETAAGEHLHQLLADLDLAAPATFSTEGEGWTWQSNCGRRHRIDYVMCPVPWLAAVVRAEVPDPIHFALEDRLDHRLAWVDFAVEVRPAEAALPPLMRPIQHMLFRP